MQVENNKDQIDCYQNVGTKLTMTLKCRDQNGIFAYKKNGIILKYMVYAKSMQVKVCFSNFFNQGSHCLSYKLTSQTLI